MHIVEQLLEGLHHFLCLLHFLVDVLVVLAEDADFGVLLRDILHDGFDFDALENVLDIPAELLDLCLEPLVLEEGPEYAGALHLIDLLDIVLEGALEAGDLGLVLASDLVDLLVEELLVLLLVLDEPLVLGEQVDLLLQGLLVLDREVVQDLVGLRRLAQHLLVELRQRLLRLLRELGDVHFEFRGQLLGLLRDVLQPLLQLGVLCGQVARRCGRGTGRGRAGLGLGLFAHL